MPPDDEDKSLDDVAGLLVVTPQGNAEADDDAGDADNSGDVDWDDVIESGTPEGTEDDADAEDETEAEADDTDAASDAENVLVTVTIDGKAKQVPLKEALAGYSRNEDYTRKTQALAEQRKAVEGEATQARTHRDAYAKLLEVIQERIGAEANDPTPEQWNAMRAENPDQYAVEWADHQRRVGQRAAVKAEQDRVVGEKQTEQATAFREFVGKQREALLVKLPDWKDAKKAEKGMKEIREYATTIGFSEAELDQAVDHRMIVMADKARRYDAIVAKRAAALKKVDAAPDMPAPGARVAPKNGPKADREAAQKKLNRTGRIEDAVPLLFK